ncbi:transcriptional repressor NrdR [Candidatus Fermentibacteria bacterium]|nr:transcriptional repressor NrdR [Candidatus Fermentibacteria bacterium]
MRCPRCGSMDDRVVDSRIAKEGRATRRRRECLDCGYRYTTYEFIETSYPVVVKKDGRREPFDAAKLEKGIARACEKRPVSARDVKDMVEKLTARIAEEFPDEVTSGFIGESVMELLHGVDQVAYVRFASVYREFRDVAQFKEELDRLLRGR